MFGASTSGVVRSDEAPPARRAAVTGCEVGVERRAEPLAGRAVLERRSGWPLAGPSSGRGDDLRGRGWGLGEERGGERERVQPEWSDPTGERAVRLAAAWLGELGASGGLRELGTEDAGAQIGRDAKVGGRARDLGEVLGGEWHRARPARSATAGRRVGRHAAGRGGMKVGVPVAGEPSGGGGVWQATEVLMGWGAGWRTAGSRLSRERSARSRPSRIARSALSRSWESMAAGLLQGC